MVLFGREKDLKDLQDVKDTLGDVQRQLRMLQLEWADTLDRLKTMMHRAIKERQRAEAAGPEETESPAAEPPGEQLDPISQRILARRNRLAQRGVPQ
jgi:hypothetical protein